MFIVLVGAEFPTRTITARGSTRFRHALQEHFANTAQKATINETDEVNTEVVKFYMTFI